MWQALATCGKRHSHDMRQVAAAAVRMQSSGCAAKPYVTAAHSATSCNVL